MVSAYLYGLILVAVAVACVWAWQRLPRCPFCRSAWHDVVGTVNGWEGVFYTHHCRRCRGHFQRKG